MNHFELSLNEETNIYINSGLTPTELFVLRLIFLAIDGDINPLVKYVQGISDGSLIVRAVLESAQSKGVILKSYKIPQKGEELIFKNIPFNKNFMKMYLRESHEIGKEFYEAYPNHIIINGKLAPLRNYTKAGFFTIEDFSLYYAKQIKNAGVTHDRIMEALEYGKENNMICYNILEFIASRKWIEIEYMRDSGTTNGYHTGELL